MTSSKRWCAQIEKQSSLILIKFNLNCSFRGLKIHQMLSDLSKINVRSLWSQQGLEVESLMRAELQHFPKILYHQRHVQWPSFSSPLNPWTVILTPAEPGRNLGIWKGEKIEMKLKPPAAAGDELCLDCQTATVQTVRNSFVKGKGLQVHHLSGSRVAVWWSLNRCTAALWSFSGLVKESTQILDWTENLVFCFLIAQLLN